MKIPKVIFEKKCFFIKKALNYAGHASSSAKKTVWSKKILSIFGLRRVYTGAAAACFSLFLPLSQSAHCETRTLRLYHLHTRESLTVTYKEDGQYISSAMTQLNYFFRDWRRNKIIEISPKTIDLIWELYQQLGGRKPIDVVCGYRSFETNALLRRIGRHVAQESQHSYGRAVDLFFPDVPLEKLRNVALVKEMGGVGYYPGRAGGFVHVDTGRVRHWPAINPTQLASIYKAYSGYKGAGNGSLLRTEVASLTQPTPSYPLLSDTPKKTETVSFPQTTTVPPPPLPLSKPVLKLAQMETSPQDMSQAIDEGVKVPLPQTKPQVLVQLASLVVPPLPQAKPSQDVVQSYDVTPVALPVKKKNFSQDNADLMTGMTLAVLAQSQQAHKAPVPNTALKGGLAAPVVALNTSEMAVHSVSHKLSVVASSAFSVNRARKGDLE